MTAQPLLGSTILMRVMTVFLFVLIQKRLMAPFTDNTLGLMRVMCGTRVTLLSLGTREYHHWLDSFVVLWYRRKLAATKMSVDGVLLSSI